MNPRGVSRREWLQLAAAGGAALGARGLARADEPSGKSTGRDRPRNLIFMVADGMSLGAPSLAEPFSQMARSRGTHFYRLWTDAACTLGFFEMGSLNSLVTDSSAASSSWSSGSRIFNNAVNQLPDGTRLVPIAPLLRERGIVGRDAAFATELTYGTCRTRGLLDAVIASAAGRPPARPARPGRRRGLRRPAARAPARWPAR